MALFDNYPYTNFQDLNLDWLISKVKEYITNFETLEDFVNSSLEEQLEIITNAINDFKDELDDMYDYIQTNLVTIANDIINTMIEEGTLSVGMVYDASTEALRVVITN